MNGIHFIPHICQMECTYSTWIPYGIRGDSKVLKILVLLQLLSLVSPSVVSSLVIFNSSYQRYSPLLPLMEPSSDALKCLSTSLFTWSICHSTCPGHKIPQDSDEILWKAFLCLAYIIKHKDIPSALIANSDQTQTLAQGCSMTYVPMNLKQVTMLGSEEKRAITVLVTLVNDGKVLLF